MHPVGPFAPDAWHYSGFLQFAQARRHYQKSGTIYAKLKTSTEKLRMQINQACLEAWSYIVSLEVDLQTKRLPWWRLSSITKVSQNYNVYLKVYFINSTAFPFLTISRRVWIIHHNCVKPISTVKIISNRMAEKISCCYTDPFMSWSRNSASENIPDRAMVYKRAKPLNSQYRSSSASNAQRWLTHFLATADIKIWLIR